MRIEAVLDRLRGVKRSGDNYVAQCPAHEDRRPSLSVREGGDGRVLLHCHAGCPFEAITVALGVEPRELFPDDDRPSLTPTVVARYDYRDEQGTLLYQVERLSPKGFRQRRPDGTGGWTYSLGDTRRALYRLPELQGRNTVYVVEGEKDADRLWALRWPATTNAGGAGKWRDDYTEQLKAAGVSRVVILPDNDEPGRVHARRVAHVCLDAGLTVKVVQLPGLPPKGDVSDWLDAGHNKDDLSAAIQSTAVMTPETLPASESSASNPPEQYDRTSTAADVLAAAGLEVIPESTDLSELEPRLRHVARLLRGADALRIETIRDVLVARLKNATVPRAAALVDAALQRRSATGDADKELLVDDEPWSQSVDGSALVNTLLEVINRHVILPSDAAAVAIALWILLTYSEANFNVLPLLLVTSPTKRCGKTKVLEVGSMLARRALPVSNITPAALYRAIEKWSPTLLIDEADTFIREDAELRGVINAGHTRHTAKVIRCVGDDSEPRVFSTWAPKLIAMIGVPRDTMIDRSIVVQMARKGASERVQSIRADTGRAEYADLRRQCRRWAEDHAEALRQADPPVPSVLNDRARDNWRGMLAIADAIGEPWSLRSRAAAVAIAGATQEDEPLGEQLLTDLRIVFNETARDILPTARVVELLVGLDSRPWTSYRHDRPLTQHQLATLLRRFSVRPVKAKIDGRAVNVYCRADLEPVWTRYLPGDPPVQVGTSEPPNASGHESMISGRNPSDNGSDPQNAKPPMNTESVPGFRPDNLSPEEMEDGELF